jgi:hypothetical protein
VVPIHKRFYELPVNSHELPRTKGKTKGKTKGETASQKVGAKCGANVGCTQDPTHPLCVGNRTSFHRSELDARDNNLRIGKNLSLSFMWASAFRLRIGVNLPWALGSPGDVDIQGHSARTVMEEDFGSGVSPKNWDKVVSLAVGRFSLAGWAVPLHRVSPRAQESRQSALCDFAYQSTTNETAV